MRTKKVRTLTNFYILPFLFIIIAGQTRAQEEKTSFKSLVPQYSFPSTLEEQLEALKTNPLLLRFHESQAGPATLRLPFDHQILQQGDSWMVQFQQEL